MDECVPEPDSVYINDAPSMDDCTVSSGVKLNPLVGSRMWGRPEVGYILVLFSCIGVWLVFFLVKSQFF